MHSGHVLPELVNVTFYDYAGLTGLGSLSKRKGGECHNERQPSFRTAHKLSPVVTLRLYPLGVNAHSANYLERVRAMAEPL